MEAWRWRRQNKRNEQQERKRTESNRKKTASTTLDVVDLKRGNSWKMNPNNRKSTLTQLVDRRRKEWSWKWGEKQKKRRTRITSWSWLLFNGLTPFFLLDLNWFWRASGYKCMYSTPSGRLSFIVHRLIFNRMISSFFSRFCLVQRFHQKWSANLPQYRKQQQRKKVNKNIRKKSLAGGMQRVKTSERGPLKESRTGRVDQLGHVSVHFPVREWIDLDQQKRLV